MLTKTLNFSKRALSSAGLLGAALAIATPVSAIEVLNTESVRLNIEVHTVGRLQALDNSARDSDAAGFAAASTDLGFQHAIGNLGMRLFWEDAVEIFFDATMASRVAADKWWGHQGYMYISQLPSSSGLQGVNTLFEFIDIKAGQFIVDYGNEINRRSLNADAQRNPLVGNPVVSPHATEVGVEIIHQNPNGFGAMVGFGSGVATDDFSDASNMSYRAKVWGDVPAVDGLHFAASYYRISHGDSLGRGANLFRTDRLGSPYASIWGGGGGAGQVMIGDGTNLKAWQLDLGWEPASDLAVWTFFGSASDDRGATDESWKYYGVTGKYDVVPDLFYVAARYSAADADRFGSDSNNDGIIERVQVGGGVWVIPNMLLFKAEYVHQTASGFSGGNLGGVQLAERPKFRGVIAEVSLSF